MSGSTVDLQDHTLRPVLKAKDKKTCRKSKVFVKRPFTTDEQIQEGKRNQDQKSREQYSKRQNRNEPFRFSHHRSEKKRKDHQNGQKDLKILHIAKSRIDCEK